MKIGDLERLISKVSTARISPRECIQLKRSLIAIIPIKEVCKKSENLGLSDIGKKLNLCSSIKERIEKELKEDPPALIHKGGIIRDVSGIMIVL